MDSIEQELINRRVDLLSFDNLADVLKAFSYLNLGEDSTI
jgi:hypothetical protein